MVTGSEDKRGREVTEVLCADDACTGGDSESFWRMASTTFAGTCAFPLCGEEQDSCGAVSCDRREGWTGEAVS